MPSSASFDRLFAIAVAIAAALYLVRCFAGCLLFALGRRRGATGARYCRWARVVTPQLVQRVAATIVGAAIVGGATAAAAQATAPTAPTPVPSHSLGAGHSAEKLPDLDRAPRSAPARSTKSTPSTAEASPAPAPPANTKREKLRVGAGDCLWDLAAAQLGPDSTPTTIDKQWRRWYRLNAKTIGANPNVIYPGTILEVPEVTR